MRAASQLVELLERQFELQIRAASALRKTPANQVYRLECKGHTVFLKLRIDAFSRARVAEEAALIDYLNGSGFKAPALVKDPLGESLFESSLEGSPVWGYLTEEIEIDAERIDLEDDAHVEMAACRLAEFHSLSDALGSDFTTVSWTHRHLIDRNLARIEPLLADRDTDFTELCRRFDRVKADISRDWAKTQGSWGIVHGDLHATNMVVDRDRELWFLDFESFGNGWRIQDIVYLLGDAIAPRGPLDLPRLRDRYAVFIEEYSKRAPRIGRVSEFPLEWLAVCLLLQFCRSAPEASALDGFLEKVRTLTQAV